MTYEHRANDLEREWRERVDVRFDKAEERDSVLTEQLAKLAGVVERLDTKLEAVANQPKQTQQMLESLAQGGGCLYMLVSVSLTMLAMPVTIIASVIASHAFH